MRALNTNITGELKNSAQMRGIADAQRFHRCNDDELDAYVAFRSVIGLPIGEEPLSLSDFTEFEDYLSGFYGERLRVIRERLNDEMEYYKRALREELEKRKPIKVETIVPGGFYPKGGTLKLGDGNEYKNSKTGPKRDKRAATKNRRSTRRNSRRN